MTPRPTQASEDESWALPEDDLEARLDEVSEGELILLQQALDKPVHHHRNNVHITPDSLNDGWVRLEQCHYHLDPVSATEIVYHPQRIRNLRLLSSWNISETRVEGNTVQLQGIGRHAKLCLQAETQALSPIAKGRYRLKNGPYMRRFLDGYYPMRVTMEIHYPPHLLKLTRFHPAPGDSGYLQQQAGLIVWDSWFSGRLFTEFDFHHTADP